MQGPSGNDVDQIVSGGLHGRATGWHPLQALKCLPTSLSIPGHHTLVLRFCLVPTTPKWFLWARAKVLGHRLLGVTMRVPINTSWPMTHISPTTVIYCLHFSNCPVAIIAFLASLSPSSRVVFALIATNLRYSSVHRWWSSGSTFLWSSWHNRRYQKHMVNLCQTNSLQAPLYSLLDITLMVNKVLKLFTCTCYIFFFYSLWALIVFTMLASDNHNRTCIKTKWGTSNV